MAEVQNVGAVDYAQYQPSEYQYDDYANNYNMQPEVYDENAAEMRAASKSHVGATLLAGAVVAGLAYLGGHAIGKRAAKGEIEKAKEAVAKYEEAQRAMAEVEKTADEHAGDFFGPERIGRDFYNKIKELFKPFKKTVEKAEEAAEGAERAVEDAKDDIIKSASEAKRPTHS